MLKVLKLASWHPKSGDEAAGRFILDQADALLPWCEVQVLDASDRRSFLPLAARARWKAWNILRTNPKPDLIHAHAAFPAGVIGQWLGRKWGVPVLLTEHTGPISLLFPYFGSQKAYAAHLGGYAKLLGVSSFQAQNLKALSPGMQADVVGNVVEKIFLEMPAVSPPAQNRAIFIGSLSDAKGAGELLEALRIYDRGGFGELRMTLLGRGGEFAEEAVRASESFEKVELRFVEPTDRSGLCREILDHAFLVLPSRYESFSLVAAEALSLGRPVVGFDCGGPRDFINGAHGELLSRRSAEELALKMREFATSPRWAVTAEASRARRDAIKALYSAEVIGRKLFQIYDGAIRDFMRGKKT